MKVKNSWPVFKGAFHGFSEDNVLRLSAALAYYAIFSIGPLLVISVWLASFVFGHETVSKQIEGQLQGVFGEGSAKILDSMMAARRHSITTISITTILGIVALVFGAAGVFGQLQDALNTIWEVRAKPGRGIWGFIRDRFLSLAMVLGIGFLLLISMALTTFLTAVTGSLGDRLPLSESVAHGLNFALSFGVISLLFAMIFKFLPDVKIPFAEVWVGALGTALLFTMGKYLLALYLGRESTTSSYGAAGSVIAIFLWVYYASVILLFGAEFTRAYAKHTGAKLVLTHYAVPVTHAARAQQGMPAQRKGPVPVTATKSSENSNSHRSPGRVVTKFVRQDPWQFVGLLVAAGFVGGVLLKSKSMRRGFGLYLALRKPAKSLVAPHLPTMG